MKNTFMYLALSAAIHDGESANLSETSFVFSAREDADAVNMTL